MDDYATPVLRSAQICELLLMNYFQNMGIPVEDDGRVGPDKELTFIYARKEKTLLPEKCRRYIEVITRYRNMSAHLVPISYEQMLCFKMAFDCFSAWFLLNRDGADEKKADSIQCDLLYEKLGIIMHGRTHSSGRRLSKVF